MIWVFLQAITVHSNLTWALNDLFIIIASSALAMRFKQISQKLIKERNDFKVKLKRQWNDSFLSIFSLLTVSYAAEDWGLGL